MSIYDDELSIIKDSFNYKVLICGNLIWVTHYIKIMEYSEKFVKLKIKDNALIIKGVGLKIKMLDKKEIILNGEFDNIFLEKPHDKGE